MSATNFFDTSQKTATVSDGKLEITPRIIDFGHRVIQLSQVSSVIIGYVHPGRVFALILLVVALGTFGAAMNSSRYSNDGAGVAVFGVIALIGAAILWLWKNEFLLITTSDGRRLQIDAKRKLLEEILLKIRDAMLFEPGRDVRYTVNLTAGKIEIGSIFDLRTANVVNSPGATAVAGDVGNAYRPAPAGSAPPSAPASYAAQPHASYGANGSASSAAAARSSISGRVPTGPPSEPGPAYPHGHGGGARTATVSGSPGGIAVAGDAHNAKFETTIEMIAMGEIRELIALIERRDVAHKADIVALLDAVAQSLAAGPARRREAQASWRSFADYALKYMGHLDGVLSAVERIGRMLG